MSQPPINVIACEALRLELEAVRGEARIHYMDFALHRTPKVMPERLRTVILETEAQAAVRLHHSARRRRTDRRSFFLVLSTA